MQFKAFHYNQFMFVCGIVMRSSPKGTVVSVENSGLLQHTGTIFGLSIKDFLVQEF